MMIRNPNGGNGLETANRLSNRIILNAKLFVEFLTAGEDRPREARTGGGRSGGLMGNPAVQL